MKIVRSAAALAVLAGAMAVPGMSAAQNLEDAVKARQGHYQAIRYHAGIIFGMARGEIEYNENLATAAAGNIASVTNMNVLVMFPAGSDKDALPGETRALPEIWSNRDEFVAKYVQLRAAAENVAARAGGGVAELGEAAGTLGQACQS